MCTFVLWSHSDYYGGSVALGLAPGRRSRVSLVLYVRAWSRPSTHPYTRRNSAVSRPVGLRPSGVRETYTAASRGVSLVTGPQIDRSGLDFRQSSFGLATRVWRDHGSLTSHVPRFSG